MKRIEFAQAACLGFARALHTAIYVIMVGCIFLVLYSGVTGSSGPWLFPALCLLASEAWAFAASGMKCPMTALVARYAAGRSDVSDTFFSRRLTRYTLQVFGPLLALGVALLAARMWTGSLD